MLENKSFSQIIGSSTMPYLNQLADSSALLSQSYAASTPYMVTPTGGAPRASTPTAITTATWTKQAQFTHALPSRGSQTNYFNFYTGHNQGFLPDWFQQTGSGRTVPANSAAYQDQYGNLLMDVNGVPTPSFSGEIGLSNELVTQYLRPSLPFTTPNLGAAIINQGFTFATFSESLPYPSFNGKNTTLSPTTAGYTAALAAASESASDSASIYARRHNPAINWIDFRNYGVTTSGYTKTITAAQQRFLIPMSSNLGFVNTVDLDSTKYPGFAVDKNGVSNNGDFTNLPTVSIVVPNNMDNIHSSTRDAADAGFLLWVLQARAKAYAFSVSRRRLKPYSTLSQSMYSTSGGIVFKAAAKSS